MHMVYSSVIKSFLAFSVFQVVRMVQCVFGLLVNSAVSLHFAFTSKEFGQYVLTSLSRVSSPVVEINE